MIVEQKTVQYQEIALLGNPNSGKTSLFNALTGLRHKTGNYPGVTVERKEGKLVFPSGKSVRVLDLPGAYSLLPRSIDEEVVHNVLYGVQKGTPPPDLVIMVLDASNLERNLYLASQVIETGIPVIFALNMWDLAEQKGEQIDIDRFQALTGVPCVKTIARRGEGIGELLRVIESGLQQPHVVPERSALRLRLSGSLEKEVEHLAGAMRSLFPQSRIALSGEAVRSLTDRRFRSPLFAHSENEGRLEALVTEARGRLSAQGIDCDVFEAEARYQLIDAFCAQIRTRPASARRTLSDRIDYMLTHPVFGLVAFFLMMGVIFESIFRWADLPMHFLATGVKDVGWVFSGILPDGQLKSLIVDGIIAGVGNVVVFLPQIFLLFFFIAFLEDFGYMARAAFVLDRLMKAVGLNGRAFLPLLSCFACAVPGIMATRTIEDRNDRLATILVAPLMSCSARLPVYTLMIAAFIPPARIFGIFDLQGVTLLGMYILGLVAGLVIAAIFRKSFLKGQRTPFIFELPPYRIPRLGTVLAMTWDKVKEFLVRAGSIIFFISILLWFLVSYPKAEEAGSVYEDQKIEALTVLSGGALESRLAEIRKQEMGERLRVSYAGQLGRWIEPVIEPLGFDWKIGIGLIASLAAREVLISTLAIVYNLGDAEHETSIDLVPALRGERSEKTGREVYTPLVALSLMIFFVFACQCMSTLSIVARETHSVRWPVFMLIYMTVLAWTASFVVYQGGKALGFS
ncbi:MAG: ferrous iron transport protein B [Candidatus Omnitrophota bacterium]